MESSTLDTLFEGRRSQPQQLIEVLQSQLKHPSNVVSEHVEWALQQHTLNM